MPSSATHAYFVLDVYDRLDKLIQKKLIHNKENLKTFSQSGDILFFCNNIKRGKEIRQLGRYMHQNKSREFFINLITYIKENKLEGKPEVISFLYGFITHYVLDSTIHPYVFYKTGVFDKKTKSTHKYNALHREMEMYIDAFMIYTNEGIKTKDFKIHNFCFNTNSFSKDLENVINYTFKETFNKKNIATVYLGSIKQMRMFFYIFKYDPLGIKKLKYRFFDNLLPKSVIKWESISYHINHKDKEYYLNLDKNTWNNPVDETEIYNLSFIELYRISIQKALTIIEEVNEVLYKKKDLDTLDNIFLNASYITGKPCEEKQKLQYFEF